MKTSERHERIIHGHGLCSVPMWCNGLPAGFCDRPAYGPRPDGEEWRNHATGRMHRVDGKYAGYVPALACPDHGGPTVAEHVKGMTVLRFNGQPGPEGPRFIEAERDGSSVSVGRWIKDGDDWLLVLDPMSAAEEE